MNHTTWLLVCNASRARLLKVETPSKLHEVETLEHPESRQHGADLNTDRQGRVNDSVGTGRHALEETTPPKEVEANRFSAEVAAFIEDARKQDQFSRLFIAASPAFLGQLRKELSDQVSSLIVDTVDKDLTSVETGKLHEHIYLTLGTD